MEISYIAAGKRFKAENVDDLNNQLSVYKLISNLNEQGLGNLSVRKISDEITNNRYDIIQAYGDPADFDNYDVVIGKLIANNGYNKSEVIDVELSELEKVLIEVKQDIPDAKILSGSHWS